ncbi:hypothetical protein [Stenotrophomonas maltophilia]|uniref:hypothetical protein n=1 Tax=Stenotrophomonas maltophilia TaxID=40324 RepID=UPI001269EBE4|nr:hypothetical protein [Stenotrophomonas maltophilia]
MVCKGGTNGTKSSGLSVNHFVVAGRRYYRFEVVCSYPDQEVIVRSIFVGVVAGATLFAAAPVFASDRGGGDYHGSPLASAAVSKAGLGETNPAAADISADPAWQVYAFQRDGMVYLQVNDLTGQVKLIIGNAAGAYFALPAGKSAALVSLPGQRLTVPSTAKRSEVYRAQDVVLVRYATADGDIWSIETP